MTDSIGPGALLAGRFRLDDLLDESSGAGFWRATDVVLARSVAVHVLPDSDPRARPLLDGARSSALVTDPHLLRVLDAAASDGLVYVVHEWGSGDSLDRLVAEAPLSPRRAAWVVKEVADAIANAHRHGAAHGRLLPENVMVTEAGSVKLIGFVVDAVLRSPGGAHPVVDGRPVSAHESDVLNLAGLLYAALVARWPGTEGSTVPAAPREHGRPLRPRRVRAGVPRPLDAICEQVLNAGSRPGTVPITTAHEVAAALADFVGDPVGGTPWGPAALEPTAALDRNATRTEAAGTDTDLEPPTESLVDDGHRTAATAAPSGLPTSGPRDPAHQRAAADPEQTQAGAPVFFDDGSTTAWTSPDVGPGPSPGWAPHRDAEPPADQDPAAPDSDRQPPGRSATSSPQRPARPLFADEPTVRVTDPTMLPPTAATGGKWGDHPHAGAGRAREEDARADQDPGPVPAVHGEPADVPRRRRRAPLVLAAAVLVGAAGVAQALGLGVGGGIAGFGRDAEGDPGQSSSDRPSTTPVASAPVPIKGVSDFDPLADPPEENPDLAPLAVDGKPDTAWQTVTYQNRPTLGGLKEGVGLLLDLGETARVGQVRVTLDGGSTALRILAAPAGARSAPSSTDGLKTVASDRSAEARVRLDLSTRIRTRWLVVWLTRLPSAPGGYQGQVAEVSVRS